MPELPEVETIKLGLQKKIIGLKISKIQINSPKSFIGNPNLVEGQKVLNIWRRAKILGVDLTGNVTMLFHLKMTGQLVYESQVARVKSLGKNKKSLYSRFSTLDSRFIGGHPTPDMVGPLPNSHTRAIFTFSDGSNLYFNDQRRFGWIKVVQGDQGDWGNLGNLGPEPLERSFTWEVLKENLLKHKKIPIKVALMDQSVVSGVGNIYANEACFMAGIDPRAVVITLTDEQFQALYSGVVKALREGIKHGGSTRAHFVDAQGHQGYFLDYAYVYALDKHPCRVCGNLIKKVTLGGRGTYFCPGCQKV